MNKMIEFIKVNKEYPDFKIDNLNLTINKKEFITIIGKSGSGKTTLLKMINGLVKPDQGSILIDNKNINDLDIINLRRNIGYVIQHNGLFKHLNIKKNISYVLDLENKLSKEQKNIIINDLLVKVDLEPSILDKYVDEISGGQQQRVGIARALAASPSLMLMDEPYGALDTITRKTLQEEITRIHQELDLTIVFVTHDINEALQLASKVVIMQDGQIVQFDTPVNIKSNPANDYVKELLSSIE